MPNKYRHLDIPERFKDSETLFQSADTSTLPEGKPPLKGQQKGIDCVLKKLESKSLTAFRLTDEILELAFFPRFLRSTGCHTVFF
ncbi:MAG: hypothetical protein R6U68_13325 [Desulfobacteraceae bacterium]